VQLVSNSHSVVFINIAFVLGVVAALAIVVIEVTNAVENSGGNVSGGGG
jgi:hypothetical protein